MGRYYSGPVLSMVYSESLGVAFCDPGIISLWATLIYRQRGGQLWM